MHNIYTRKRRKKRLNNNNVFWVVKLPAKGAKPFQQTPSAPKRLYNIVKN